MKKPINVPADEWQLALELVDAGERNQKFAQMSAAEKRVAVAKDVILQLDLAEIRPTNGTYWNTIYGTCDVCALGACFLTTAGLVKRKFSTNPCDVNYYGSVEEMRQVVAEGGFTEDMIKAIEAAFEGWGPTQAPWGTEATRAFNVLPDDTLRPAEESMRRIMQNIIDNNGDFRP